MADPITTEDLYGKSSSPEPESSAPTVDPTPPAPVHFEETPEITPITESAHTHPPPASAPSPASTQPMHPIKKSGSFLGTLFTVLIFLGLFVGGIWLSSVVRQFLPQGDTQQNARTIPTPAGGIPGIGSIPTSTGSAEPSTQWKTYDVISGTTKLSFANITFKLPSSILSPICDGTGCASQGTYLPGGTRFTVAPRGVGEALADFRGNIISDVNGISFTTKKVTIAGRPATEFTGSFTGRTVAGYAFSKMRGVMVEITPTTSLEVNHFIPNGVTADFVTDDVLFDAILNTITIPGAVSSPTLAPTSSIPSVATPTPKPATGSGN